MYEDEGLVKSGEYMKVGVRERVDRGWKLTLNAKRSKR